MRAFILAGIITMLTSTGALAQEAAGAPPAPNPIMSFLPLIVIGLIMYFLIIRPQSKLKKQHEEMVGGLKRGDVVVTAGGIRGTVTRVDDNKTMSVEIAPGVEVTVVKATILELEIRKGDPKLPANDVAPKVEKKKKK